MFLRVKAVQCGRTHLSVRVPVCQQLVLDLYVLVEPVYQGRVRVERALVHREVHGMRRSLSATLHQLARSVNFDDLNLQNTLQQH